MKAIKYITILVASIVIFNSCTKQVAGPAGPTGAQGAQGAAAGYSVTIDSVASTAWANPTTGVYTFTINNIKALTNTSYCIVEPYYSLTYNSLSTWTQFPGFNIFTAGDFFLDSYSVYTVTITYLNSAPAPPPSMTYFKIIVINQP